MNMVPFPQPRIDATPERQPAVTDRYARPLRDLRVSVLDRCNLRCTYCMPEDELAGTERFLSRADLLSDDELVTMIRLFTRLGVSKIRLTGGEPLLRPGLPSLVRRIAALEAVEDLALTTNAMLLPRQAQALADAGLGRITVSLDSLDPVVFRTMSGQRGSVDEVLAGIAAAERAGFRRLKINTVIQRGVNDEGVLDVAAHFRGSGHTVRFIEFMDVGNVNHWSREQVVPSAELLKRIHDRWPLRPVAQQASSDTARRYAYEDGAGEVGFISSITEPFCGDCTRARLTADGTLYNCLFADRGLALRPLLRQGASEERLLDCIFEDWRHREDRYSEQRSGIAAPPQRVEMYRMGG